MGREVRRVISNWDHPKNSRGQYLPMNDRPYIEALNEWIDGHNKWEKGEDPAREEYGDRFYSECYGNPPMVEYYRPEWKEAEMTWYQLYENVSEGTPITPPFETQEDLCAYLVDNGDFLGYKWTKEQAEGVIGAGFCPSGVVQNGLFMTGQEFAGKSSDK